MDEMTRFILQTHQVEKLNCAPEDIQNALKRRPDPNPYVVGHFEAMNYLISLVGSPDIPSRDPNMLFNLWRSEEALAWVKTLHAKITLPLSKCKDPRYEHEFTNVRQYECGVYRNVPVNLAFSPAPPPEIIPYLLWNWLLKVSNLHAEVKDNIDNPYGLSREQAEAMVTTSTDTVLFFANVQPFYYGSNRVGRLVENLIRLQWNLPWKAAPTGRDYDEFVKDIQQFGQNKMPQLMDKAREKMQANSV